MSSEKVTSYRHLFFQQFKENSFHVGAILPSSRFLGRASTAFLACRQSGSVRVLEAGAGTGAFTQEIVPLLHPGDSLDIVEINPKLMFYLKQRFHHETQFQTQGVNVQFVNDDIRNISADYNYDYIIFSLPLTNFPPSMVQSILDLMMKRLKPGGVFSYVKYIFVGRLKYLFSGSMTKEQMKANQVIIDAFAKKYQLERRVVLLNIPPARAYFWQKPIQ